MIPFYKQTWTQGWALAPLGSPSPQEHWKTFNWWASSSPTTWHKLTSIASSCQHHFAHQGNINLDVLPYSPALLCQIPPCVDVWKATCKPCGGILLSRISVILGLLRDVGNRGTVEPFLGPLPHIPTLLASNMDVSSEDMSGSSETSLHVCELFWLRNQRPRMKGRLMALCRLRSATGLRKRPKFKILPRWRTSSLQSFWMPSTIKALCVFVNRATK